MTAVASATGGAGHGSPLDAIGELASRARSPAIAMEACETAGRLAEGRFHMACFGQFKRGKSTLLNALVGEPVLPMGIVPVTSAITVLRHGPRHASVTFEDGRTEAIPVDDIARFVSEGLNPENRLGVHAVEVFLPSPLLASGLCLVDTPGLGSVFEGNSAVTRRFVPQVDAALLIIGADPPISGDEVALVEQIAAQARHLFLVMNKADRLTDTERAEGARFAMEVLSQRLRRPMGRVYQVSAVEGLDGEVPTRDLGALTGALTALARTAGADLLDQANARAVARLGRGLLAELDERRDALLRPLEESERRLADLEVQLAEAERAMADLGVLLTAEEARLARTYVARQEAFFPEAQADACRVLGERLATLTVPRTALWAAALEATWAIAEQVAERFRGELVPEAEAAYRASMARFVDLANQFLERTAAKAGWTLAPRPLGAEIGFRVQGDLRFTELRSATGRLPFAVLLDLARPRRTVLRSADRRAQALLARLIETNASRVAYDLAERAGESRRRLEREVRERLREVRDVTRQAVEEARLRRAEGEEAVQTGLSRLDALRSELEPLLAARLHGGEAP
jgi:Dynamin family